MLIAKCSFFSVLLQEAKAKGKAARERMIREYSPEALGPFVANLLRRADAYIP